jgi:hypothetical protein
MCHLCENLGNFDNFSDKFWNFLKNLKGNFADFLPDNVFLPKKNIIEIKINYLWIRK